MRSTNAEISQQLGHRLGGHRGAPVGRVVDADGNLVGYFACSFLEREVVEYEDFDPSQALPHGDFRGLTTPRIASARFGG